MHGPIGIHAPGIERQGGDCNKWLLSPFIPLPPSPMRSAVSKAAKAACTKGRGTDPVFCSEDSAKDGVSPDCGAAAVDGVV